MPTLDTPLSDEELDALDTLLLERVSEEEVEQQGGDEGIIDIAELDGFLTAIVSGPQAIPFAEWLPVIWGDFEPKWASPQESEATLSLIIRHMNGIVNTLMQAPDTFEPIVMSRTVDEREITIVDEWCQGYMKGVALSAEAWRAAGEEPMEMLFPIMIFTTEKGWEQLDKLDDNEVSTLQQSIPNAVRKIHTFWLARRQPQPFTHDGPQVGRNDPCPCGSGKKFKKCCLH